MNTEGNWYRQLLALVLLSASKAAVEYITNPGSREDATNQLKEAFASIDYNALGQALTQAINNAADLSKGSLNEAIDTLRERSVDAVDTAKSRAEKQLGRKRGGGRLKLFFGLLLGAAIAYFVLDEQRRDELLDRLTGASGPIEQTVQSTAQSVTATAQQATQQATQQAAETASDTAETTTEQ